MNTYRCKHTVEAAQWHDTDENREAFASWFEKHDAMFETRGPIVVLPEEGEVAPGDWILLFDDGEFVPMTDDEFRTEYESVPS